MADHHLDRQIAGFLRAGASRPFVWGECDCCTWASAWVALRTGVDPSAPLRGRYATRRGAYRHIGRAGGMAALTSALAEAAGLRPTHDPSRGDIGLVVDDVGHEVLAIRLSGSWAGKTVAGICMGPFVMRLAWIVP